MANGTLPRPNTDAPIKYALTKTYRFTDYMKNETPFNQFRHTIVPLGRLLNKYCSDWEVCPELTNDGIIHYHGMLTITDEYGFFRFLLPRLKRSGFIKLKNIDNYKKWKQYCTKKQHKYAMQLFDLHKHYPINKNNIKNIVKDIKKKLDAVVDIPFIYKS